MRLSASVGSPGVQRKAICVPSRACFTASPPLPCGPILRRQRMADTAVGASALRKRQEPASRTNASGASVDTTQVVPSTDSGHAFLHDFCVTIPYGCAVGVLAVVAYLQQAGSIATTLLAASVSALSLTYLSLQNWRARKPCKPYTLLTAAVAAAAAYFSWQQGSAVSAWLRLPSTLASAAVGLFLLYNVLAGGNPPPGEKPLADAAPHSINN